MKSRTLYILTIAAATMLGCSDDILDKKSLTSYSEDNVFADYALLDAYVLGTYRGMGHPFGGEGNNFSEILTDNAYDQHSTAMQAYTHGETSRDNGETPSVGLWSNAYTNIRRVNTFFEKTEGSTTIAAADLKRASGEMRFLRAFFYAKLMSYYGGVPVITKTAPLGQANYDLPRNTVDEVVSFIVSECDQAITELDTRTTVAKGRISKEAAMALKARTLLYAASPLFNESDDANKWIKARDANKAVMDLAMDLLKPTENYHEIFNGKLDKEVILARYFTPQNAHGGGEWGSNLWLYPNGLGGWGTSVPTQALVDSYEMINGKLPSDAASGYDDQNPYVDRDPRFAESILFNGAEFFDPKSALAVRPMEYYRDKANPTDATKAGRESRNGANEPWNASKTSYNFRKYSDEGKPAYGDKGANESLSPFIYFRITEFYLNYAECQIRLGEYGEAQSAINAVRDRVGMPHVLETGDALLQRYRNERRVELAMEELRFDDVRRWKVGPATIGQPVMGVDIYKNGGVMEYHYDYTVDGARKWDDKMYLLPIPYSEIQASHNALTQNPNY